MTQSSGSSLSKLMKLLRAELHAHGYAVNSSTHTLKLLGEYSLPLLLLLKKLLLSNGGHCARVVHID